MRELDSPPAAPDAERVTMEQVGLLRRALGSQGSAQITPADRRLHLRNHIAPFFAGKTVDRSGQPSIQRYIARQAQDAGGQDDPQPRQHDALHLLPRLAEGLVRQMNPVKLADRPTVKKNETRIQFDQAESEQLLAAPCEKTTESAGSSPPDSTAAMTGLRQGEIGLAGGTSTSTRGRSGFVSPYVRGEFGDPKSAGSGRSVPMAERVAVALHELRERSVYARDRDLVFSHPETAKPVYR